MIWRLGLIDTAYFDAPRIVLIRIPPFRRYVKEKPLKRVLIDTFLLWIVSQLTPNQLRGMLGSTQDMYNTFVEERNLPNIVEELGNDSRLLWVGPRYTEQIILYFHGGGFVVSQPPGGLEFWSLVQKSLAEKGKTIGLAVLNFTLVPDAPFPTQLKQAIAAVQHLIDSGVKPENLQLVGDSAGGALIHGILSHMLHPLEKTPKLELSGPLGGALMISPWTRAVNEENVLFANDGHGDFLNARTIIRWGALVVHGVPESIIPYLEGNNTPERWLDGVDRLVKRIMITGGAAETLRFEIEKYAGIVEKHHKDVTLVVQANGIHNDLYLDQFAGIKNLGNLTPLILDWMDKGVAKTA
ncbi:hypothetical protein CVT25_007834 [Psilocybe cyanescens]|uniref:Alpha/beta hydrolase fold-3 domain-containing protein n=1 Tax=Psilocybe cyanescens TaxID=93625 RepID=A0A409VQ95_PSICY|nr:hypothetical protein CVT25_007834 [Psilocybe cyanescens]